MRCGRITETAESRQSLATPTSRSMKKKPSSPARRPQDVMHRVDRLLAAMAPKAPAPKAPTPSKPRGAKRTAHTGKARPK